MPVPLEAVGEGARWSVYSQVNSNGFRIVQRADVLLAELEEDRISLEMTIVQQPLEANPQMSSLPPGTEMEMLRFTSEGSAASVIELGRLVPIEASSSVGMDFAFAMVGEGQRVEAEMSMDMSMELSRLE